MKKYTPLLSLFLAFSGTTQIMNAQNNDPQNEQQQQVLGLELGAKLPQLNVTNQEGKQVPFAAAEGDRWVFVFFYPKAMTGGCTKQVCSVQAAFEKLTEHKVTVFGVSTDTAEAQMKFANKEKLNYTLVADTDKALANAMKVPLKAGDKMTSRQAYLFKDGVLVWRDVKGSTNTQGDEVLAAIKANSDA